MTAMETTERAASSQSTHSALVSVTSSSLVVSHPAPCEEVA